MGVIAKGILRGCQGLFTPVSLGYPLSVFNKNSTLNTHIMSRGQCVVHGAAAAPATPGATLGTLEVAVIDETSDGMVQRHYSFLMLPEPGRGLDKEWFCDIEWRLYRRVWTQFSCVIVS